MIEFVFPVINLFAKSQSEGVSSLLRNSVGLKFKARGEISCPTNGPESIGKGSAIL